MSNKKLTQTEIKELYNNYWDQMNILNGHDDLHEAVSKYVRHLESIKTD